MRPLLLCAMAMVLSMGWVGPSEAGGRGKGRGHGNAHHGSYYGGHYGSHHYDDHYYGHLLLYGVPPLLSVLTAWNYPARAVTAPPQAIRYEEQTGYWYYCTDPEGYYPYVRDCPRGWMQVVPSSPPR